MARAMGGAVLGGVVGLVLGVLARALMRAVALVTGTETEFDLGASLAVVSLFVVSGVGAGLAGALGLGSWKLVVVVLFTSGMLFLMGAVFAVGEIGEIYTDLPAGRSVAVSALVAGIVVLVPLTPYVGWRIGRRVS